MILLGRYELLKGYGDHHVSVGFGSYGQVKLAVDKKTGENVAVKIVIQQFRVGPQVSKKLSRLSQSTLSPPYYPTSWPLHRSLKRNNLHDSIVRGWRDAFRQTEDINFIKERHQKLLQGYLRSCCLPSRKLNYASGYKSNSILIKPENILLTNKNKAKLCDFGFAAILGERKTLCGTYEYMSPEMVQNRPYDYKIDIWALGILLFELIAGKAPFKGNSPEQVLNQMKTKIFFN